MIKNAKLKKVLLSILKLLYYIAITFVCIIAAILVYYIISVQTHAKDENYKPGISIYTIVSPSMTPNIKVYDVVVNVKVSNPKDINVGDIITFKSQAATSEGMTITHRVIARNQLPDGTYEYMTQGDNNPEPDSSYVMFDNVIGKEILTIRGLGKLQFLIANKKSWLFLLLIPIVIYLIKEIYKLIDLVGLKKKVTKVTEETIEEPKIDHDKQELLKQQLKKELLEELKLEQEEKRLETISINQPSIISPTKPLFEQKKEESELPKIEEKKSTQIENIEFELPKMKKENNNKKEEIKEKEYLDGKKIKVVEIEDTKNKKKDKTKISLFDDNRINLDIRTSIPRKNPNLKVERPESEDIQELRKQTINNQPKKPPHAKKLNLNPQKIKKVNRNKNNTNSKKKQLNLNPHSIKRINRYKKQKQQVNNGKNDKKKNPLIIIEKIQ